MTEVAGWTLDSVDKALGRFSCVKCRDDIWSGMVDYLLDLRLRLTASALSAPD